MGLGMVVYLLVPVGYFINIKTFICGMLAVEARESSVGPSPRP